MIYLAIALAVLSLGIVAVEIFTEPNEPEAAKPMSVQCRLVKNVSGQSLLPNRLAMYATPIVDEPTRLGHKIHPDNLHCERCGKSKRTILHEREWCHDTD